MVVASGVTTIHLVKIEPWLAHSERSWTGTCISVSRLPSRTRRRRPVVRAAELRLRLLVLFEQGLSLPLSLSVGAVVRACLLVSLLPAIDTRLALHFVLIAFFDLHCLRLSLKVWSWWLGRHLL